MSSPWTAAQLDRIEDALEDLERGGVPASLGESPEAAALEAPLTAYRQILTLSREAMPMQEVPAGLLDGVLAEAHAAVAEAPAALPHQGHTAHAAAEAPRSWWQRARATIWVPALGFAAAAAALLVFIRPASDAESDAASTMAQREQTAEPPAAAAKAGGPTVDGAAPTPEPIATDPAQGRIAAAEPDAEPEPDRLLDPKAEPLVRGGGVLGGVVADGDEDDRDAVLSDEARGAGAQTKADRALKDLPWGRDDTKPSTGRRASSSPAADAEERKTEAPKTEAPKKKKPTKGSSNNAGGSAGPSPGAPPTDDAAPKQPAPVQPQPEPAPAPTEPAKTTKPEGKLLKLADRGEQRRRSGNCGLARLDFQSVRKSVHAPLRARALAGLGLCEWAAGNEAAANSLFSQARGQDPAVGAFIDRERAKLAPKSQQKK